MTLARSLVPLLLLTASAAQAQVPPATEASVAAHVEAATRAAGGDLKPLLGLCQPASPTRPTVGDDALAALIAKPAPPAARAFDNLTFVGAAWVSAWAIDTSDGIVLIDALNHAKEAEQLIEGGLRQVGLDPARIKYIVVTHGHGDHYGGVNHLVGRYGARVVASEADWAMMAGKLEFESKIWDVPPKHDIAVVDGESITLGGTRVVLYQTPGHTLGTVSPVFEVTQGGKRHRVLEWGGTGFNFGKDLGRLDAYIASTRRMRALAAEQNIDVLISNHAGIDEAPAKLAKLKVAQGGGNPFVLGVEGVQRSLTVMGECALAQRDRFRMMP